MKAQKVDLVGMISPLDLRS